MQNIIFGPIHSRRFGISLGIDLSPSKKQCNFDCLYCELGGAKTMGKMEEVLEVEQILDTLFKRLKSEPKLDVITLSANGEPTLYPHLYELITKIKEKIGGKYKTLILSNGSCFGDPQVQKALKEFDIVKFSLDCYSAQCFKKLDRPNKSLDIEQIKEGIKDFAKKYDGELVAEILVLKNLNDNLEEMHLLANFMREVGVHRVDLGTLDRPPAYRIEGVDIEILKKLSLVFEGQCVSIPVRKEITLEQKTLLESEEDVLEILKKRPISVDEFSALFDGEQICKKMLENGKIQIKKVANMSFFAPIS
ncbi:radical SAM protein [Helicobacter cholecystus]|uniref:radical SAM protein n=1 Tax=Helicobacter cholecystus TaxID=45498 RepID=UPI0027387960|nr:radical SAM protein [Helicobacter cholecystus]